MARIKDSGRSLGKDLEDVPSSEIAGMEGVFRSCVSGPECARPKQEDGIKMSKRKKFKGGIFDYVSSYKVTDKSDENYITGQEKTELENHLEQIFKKRPERVCFRGIWYCLKHIQGGDSHNINPFEMDENGNCPECERLKEKPMFPKTGLR